MRLRRIALALAVIVFGAVPVALAADPFGAPEVADPTWRPGSFANGLPFVGADGAGNVLLGTAFRDARKKDQVAVYERCGAGPAVWNRTVLTDAPNGVDPEHTLRVAGDGTAMVVWEVEEGGTPRNYSRTRPPGGSWGEPQLIVSGPTTVQIALSDSGAAIAAWADASPAGTSVSLRAPDGTWGPPSQLTTSGYFVNVAMSAGGDALLAYKHPTAGFVRARFKPAGGSWGAETDVLRNNFQDTLLDLKAEFDGQGRAVVMARYRELNDAIRVNVREAGAAGTWAKSLPEWEQTELNDDPAAPFFDQRNLEALVRHPQGAVAVWTRRNGTNTDVVVSRLRASGWESPVAFDVGSAFYEPRAAVDAADEILLAGTVDTAAGVTEVHGAIAPSLTAPWPGVTRMSPLASATDQYRDAFAAGGGSAFYVGWGVHGGANQRTEVISTKAAGATCAGVVTPTPTPAASATASPTPEPDPILLPAPTPTATPAPAPAAPAAPSAIADFTTLPAASKCVRGRKLTVKFKRPPKGYVVKSIAVKVNAKKVATVRGKQLKKPLYLRKLPKGTFTVTVSITLTKGKGLTEKRRYTACR